MGAPVDVMEAARVGREHEQLRRTLKSVTSPTDQHQRHHPRDDVVVIRLTRGPILAGDKERPAERTIAVSTVTKANADDLDEEHVPPELAAARSALEGEGVAEAILDRSAETHAATLACSGDLDLTASPVSSADATTSAHDVTELMGTPTTFTV